MSARRFGSSMFASWLPRLAPLALAACQSATLTPSFAPVAAPVLAVGDHWEYRITDNLAMGQVTMLEAEVVSINAGIASLRLVYNDQFGRSETRAEIDANGGLVVGALKGHEPRHFQVPIQMFDFPLAPGKNWRQTVPSISPETQLPAQILVFGNVQGQTVVTVPAGAFNTTFVFRILQLDDEQFWRTRTRREDSVWYAPEVKGPVRELRNASFVQSGGGVGSLVRTENTTRELMSFSPGLKSP
jgi:hypothetical protein